MWHAARSLARVRSVGVHSHVVATNCASDAAAVAALSGCRRQQPTAAVVVAAPHHACRCLTTATPAATFTAGAPRPFAKAKAAPVVSGPESGPSPAGGRRRKGGVVVPPSMVGAATSITQEFEFDNSATARRPRPTFLKPAEAPEPAPTLLRDAVSSLSQVRAFAVHTPCHPTSLFSLPVLNQLRGTVYNTPFTKMAVRASIDPRGWEIDPSWDFNRRLELPSGRGHPNWLKHQGMLNSNAPNPATVAAGHVSQDDANSAVTAATPEPFSRRQIEDNLHEFILSPHLHQSAAILAAVRSGQKAFFDEAALLTTEYGRMTPAQYTQSDKRVKKRMRDSWAEDDEPLHRALVDAFIRFMEDPVELPSVGQDSLNAAIAKQPQQPQDSLLKSRSGRLRFDPSLVGLSNLSAPHEWYPLARGIPRKIIVHVGPTNSGKTYHAMQRLMQARSGVYAGPLRLLAWEVYDKMCKTGVPCNLRTGQEVEEVAGACHTSSTVEMMSTSTIYDVAVIDEAQMLQANDRGWAWTRAILGVAAYEVHVCGDSSMVGLVEELAAITGEEVEVREYERLTPLHIAPPLANGLKDIKAGDCIVAFSQKMLYRLKYDIEHVLGLKCCIIYGSLPPETRRDQASKFNSPDSGYDVLVSTDAIGMGLNLNIQRVIFARMEKFDGFVNRALTVSETLQIAGRAGRFNTNRPKEGDGGTAAITTMEQAAESNAGYVTTLNTEDHPYLQHAMVQSLQPIERAGLAPTQEQLQMLHELRPKEKLSNLVTYFAQYAQLDQTYFNVDMDSFKAIADLIEHVPFKSLSERYDFCRAPARIDGGPISGAVVRFAELFAAGELVSLKSFKIPAIQLPTNQDGISAMEDLYAITELYVWLGLKFGEEIFVDTWRAIEIRQKAAEIIAAGLERMSPPESFLASRRLAIAQKTRRDSQLAANRDAGKADQETCPPAAPFVGARKDRPVAAPGARRNHGKPPAKGHHHANKSAHRSY